MKSMRSGCFTALEPWICSRSFRRVAPNIRRLTPAFLFTQTFTHTFILACAFVTNVTTFPRQQAGRSGTVQPVPRGIRFSSGSWVPFARLGGQIAGDVSPHLSRVLDEAGATEEQRRARSGPLLRREPIMLHGKRCANIFTKEQMDRFRSPQTS